MPSKITLIGACLSAALVAASPTQYSNVSSTSIPNFSIPPPENLSSLNNGSLFDQWRTKARFRFPSNNIGDPTAFWQDDEGVFHISGLYSHLKPPNVSTSSGIGVAFTNDFLTYTDAHNYTNSVSVGPGNENDPLAVFDGSVIPKGYKGLPTLIYTGVHYLPISWSKPYIKGSEVQTLAYSEDNGATWIKPKIDPVIPSPPDGFNVTGFRDPWVFQAPKIAKLLNDDPETWYLSVSSGIRQVGPRLLLYRQNASDFTSWEFLGPSVSAPVNTTFSAGNFSGNDGSNYETSNTLFLDQEGQNMTDGVAFVTMGAESGRETHSYHWSLWKMGQFVRNPQNESVIFEDHATGVLDWGIGYACTTMPDYKLGRRLGFCWSNEDFNSSLSDVLKFKTWATGTYSIPCELYYKEIPGVVADDLAAESGSWSVAAGHLNTTLAKDGVALAKANGNTTVTLTTLGCKPAREILRFRDHANRTWTEDNFQVSVSSIQSNSTSNLTAELIHKNGVTRAFIPFKQSPHSRRWELQATVQIPESSLRNPAYEDFAAGFTILHSSASAPADWPIDDSAMFYRPANESFIITRDVALSRTNINTDPEIGKLRLWNVSTASNASSFAIQNLDIRAFMDGSFFEVYVNDVLTISTHIYYWYPDSTRMGFYMQFSNNTAASLDTEVGFSNVRVWEGVPDVFPQRPTQPELLIDSNAGFVEPAVNPNLPLTYDGVGAPPLPPRENLPYGIDLSTVE